jgi:hypothetical protein
MGAAAHEVECEGHVALHERGIQQDEAEPSRPGMSVADLERLFRGA